MAYLFYCFITLPFALLNVFLSRRYQLIFYVFFVVVCVLLFGFSYKSGSDWVNYIAFYDSGCSGLEFEPGFGVLCWAFNLFGLDYWVFSFFVKSSYIFGIALFLWRLKTYPLLIFLSCVLVSFVFIENMLRQQFAFVFILISLRFIYANGYYFVFFVLLAAAFHVSAIFFMPMFFMVRYSIFRAALVGASGAAFFLGLIGVSVASGLLGWFASFWEGGYLSKAIFYLGLEGYPMTLGHYLRFGLLMVLFAFDRVYCHRSESPAEFRLLLSGSILMLSYEMLFYDFSVFWMRIREYFLIFFMSFPLYAIKNYFPVYRKVFPFVFSIYPLIVFGGIVSSLPVYSDLYEGYSNYIYYVVFDDDSFDAERDFAVDEYWKAWRRGEIR